MKTNVATLFHLAFIRAGVVTYRRKFSNPHARKSGPGRRHAFGLKSGR